MYTHLWLHVPMLVKPDHATQSPQPGRKRPCAQPVLQGKALPANEHKRVKGMVLKVKLAAARAQQRCCSCLVHALAAGVPPPQPPPCRCTCIVRAHRPLPNSPAAHTHTLVASAHSSRHFAAAGRRRVAKDHRKVSYNKGPTKWSAAPQTDAGHGVGGDVAAVSGSQHSGARGSKHSTGRGPAAAAVPGRRIRCAGGQRAGAARLSANC